MSCGDEPENPNLEVPIGIKSASAAVALRITGPYGPNDDYIVEELGRMLNDNISFMDFVTRGGMPEGTLTGNISGSAPEQVKAWFDNGGAIASAEAVDSCGNTMLAAFLTPDMVQSVLPSGSPTSQPSWPGVCAADVNCNTTKQGNWEVGFSKDHGDGSRDLVLTLAPVAGALTQPGFQGHVISFFLTEKTTGSHLLTAALYGNTRQVTISAFGLVKFAKAGVSTRPTAPLPGLPTRVWAFPADERELAGSDLIVGLAPYEFCPRSWAETFAGAAEPMGCDSLKSMVYDITSAQGNQLWTERADLGEDLEGTQALQLDIDDIIKAMEYQLKAQIACPDVTEAKWIRQDIALGSVEIFLCPDGDIDRCIGFHDMEDYWCEVPASEEPGDEFEAVLPHWEHAAAHATFNDDFDADIPSNPSARQTVVYAVNGVEKTITWTLVHDSGTSNATPITIDAVAAHLNSRMTALGLNDIEIVVEDDKFIVEPIVDLGPVGTFEWRSTGTLNARLFLTGNATTTSPTMPAASESPYDITAINTTNDIAYIKVSGTPEEPLAVYADEPARILGLTDASGNAITLPTPRADNHCTGEGAVVFEITGANQYLKLDLTTDGEDSIRLYASTVPDYIQ